MRSLELFSVTALTLALATACGKAEDDAPAAVPDTTFPQDTAPAAPDTASAEPTPVALPADFPPDLPIAPASTVVAATSTPDVGGIYSEVSIVSQGESEESYRWYRQALTDAGWQVSNEGQTDDTRTLHATQGESYVDLTVRPRPGLQGWVRVDTSVWKAGT